MSVSIPIECPHCHAQGNLADPALLGQPICCPTCQQVFVAPLPPPPPIPPMDLAPVPASAAVSDTTPVDPAVVIPQAIIPEVPAPSPAAPAAELPPQSTEQPVAAIPTTAVDGSVAAQVETPAIAPATWKFGAAPEAALTAATPVVTVAIAQASLSPSVTAVIPDPIAAAVVPIPLSPVPAAMVPDGLTHSAAGQVMPGQVMPGQVMPGQIMPGQIMPGQAPASMAPGAGMFFPPDATSSASPPVVHALDGPLPGFMAPAAPPGQAELSFAQSLPEPAARAITPPNPQSRLIQNLAIGAVSVIVLFAAVMFLMGDPFRQVGKNKRGAPKEVKSKVATPSDVTTEDAFSRINALNTPKSDK